MKLCVKSRKENKMGNYNRKDRKLETCILALRATKMDVIRLLKELYEFTDSSDKKHLERAFKHLQLVEKKLTVKHTNNTVIES